MSRHDLAVAGLFNIPTLRINGGMTTLFARRCLSRAITLATQDYYYYYYCQVVVMRAVAIAGLRL